MVINHFNMKKRLLLLLLIFNSALFSFGQSFQVVEIEGGKVQGFVENGLTIFKGIPFAAPPVGDLRWKPPQPVQSWNGVLKADKFGLPCPQVSYSATRQEYSEDCLYLNVWTPAKSSREKLPVMVWIHGGGFALGATSTPLYNGENLAQMGVVLVSIAYRVGPLGFMTYPELSAETENNISGNYGLFDMIAGLKWVKNNIHAFGGDPDKVTIFGESAGGIAVSMLCASPLGKGLFSGAISQSGGNFGPVFMDSRRDGIQHLKGAEKTGVEFMKRMGVNSIAELRKVNPQKWADDPLSQMGGFWPVVDNYVILGDQYKLYESGNYNDVNVIIGTNSDEGSMFVGPSEPEEYKKGIRKRFGPFANRILEEYPANTKEETFTSAADIFRETVFAWPSWAWARLQSNTGQSKVFFYYFDQQQSVSPFSSIKPGGAGHGAELSYIFGHLDENQYSEKDFKLSEIMMKYWTNFAKNGDPNGEGLPVWQKFSEKNPVVMYLNHNPVPGPVPNLEKLKLMEDYFTYQREKSD